MKSSSVDYAVWLYGCIERKEKKLERERKELDAFLYNLSPKELNEYVKKTQPKE